MVKRLALLHYDVKFDIHLLFREFDEVVTDIRTNGGEISNCQEICFLLAAMPSKYTLVLSGLDH